MDRKDEIIRLQMDVINQMTRSNLSRIADDLWGSTPEPAKAEPVQQEEKAAEAAKRRLRKLRKRSRTSKRNSLVTSVWKASKKRSRPSSIW